MTTAAAERHRTNQARLSALVISEAHRLDPEDVERQAALIQQGRSASSGLAARYYRAEREAAEVAGTFRPVLAAAAPPEQITRSLRWAIGTERGGRDPGVMRSLLDGEARRLVLNGGRETIIGSVRADPVADRFARVAAPGACSFCLVTAMRDVYLSAQSAGENNQYHRNCRCTVAPVFRGQEWELSEHAKEAERLYYESTGGVAGRDKLNAFRRALEATRR